MWLTSIRAKGRVERKTQEFQRDNSGWAGHANPWCQHPGMVREEDRTSEPRLDV